MSVDSSVISYIVQKPSTLRDFQRAGITAEYFVDDYAKIFRFILKTKREHGRVPSPDVVASRFSDLEIHRVRDRDAAMLVSELHDRKRYMDFLDAIDEASRNAASPEDIEVALSELQRKVNSLSLKNGQSSIVDLFSAETQERIVKDLKLRRSGKIIGIPTGFKRFDGLTGGLHKKRMVVIMGRPGLGKSWLDLLFCASAVMNGSKVMLFPLEMSLEDTAFRLYTLFSQRLWGNTKAIRNLDLSRGHVPIRKVVRLLSMLEDKFAGQLLVADIGTLHDRYTVDRVGAEVQMHGPDLYWVDYITLMAAPGYGNQNGSEDHSTVKALSNGLMHVAVSNNCVGGISAQVNRDAIKGGTFLPRIENIAYGDSIGQDAHQVFSINRKGPHLYYSLVKNREGPEIGRTRVKFAVNDGIIEEDRNQDDED